MDVTTITEKRGRKQTNNKQAVKENRKIIALKYFRKKNKKIFRKKPVLITFLLLCYNSMMRKQFIGDFPYRWRVYQQAGKHCSGAVADVLYPCL